MNERPASESSGPLPLFRPEIQQYKSDRMAGVLHIRLPRIIWGVGILTLLAVLAVLAFYSALISGGLESIYSTRLTVVRHIHTRLGTIVDCVPSILRGYSVA